MKLNGITTLILLFSLGGCTPGSKSGSSVSDSAVSGKFARELEKNPDLYSGLKSDKEKDSDKGKVKIEEKEKLAEVKQNQESVTKKISLELAAGIKAGLYSIDSKQQVEKPRIVFADDRSVYYFNPKDINDLVKVNTADGQEIHFLPRKDFHPFSDSLNKVTDKKLREQYDLDRLTIEIKKNFEETKNTGTFASKPFVDVKGNVYIIGFGLFQVPSTNGDYDYFNSVKKGGYNSYVEAPFSYVGVYKYDPNGKMIYAKGIPGIYLNGRLESWALAVYGLEIVGVGSLKEEIYLKDAHNKLGKILVDGNFRHLSIDKFLPPGSQIMKMAIDQQDNVWAICNDSFDFPRQAGSLFRFDPEGTLLKKVEIASVENRERGGYGFAGLESKKMFFDGQGHVVLIMDGSEPFMLRFHRDSGLFLDKMLPYYDEKFYGSSLGPVFYSAHTEKFYTFVSKVESINFDQRVQSFSINKYTLYKKIDPIRVHATDKNIFVLDAKNNVVHSYSTLTGKYLTYFAGFDGVKDMFLYKRFDYSGAGDIIVIEDKLGKKALEIDGSGNLILTKYNDQSVMIKAKKYIGQYRQSTGEFLLSLDWILADPHKETPYLGYVSKIDHPLPVNTRSELAIDKNGKVYNEEVAYLKNAFDDRFGWRDIYVQTSPSSIFLLTGIYEPKKPYRVHCPGFCRGQSEETKSIVRESVYFSNVLSVPTKENANISDFGLDRHANFYYVDRQNKVLSKFSSSKKTSMWDALLEQ